MKIKKFRLFSDRPEEDQFLVKKLIKKVTYIEQDMIMNKDGELLGGDENKKETETSKTIEGIVAYSINSRTKAIVEVLETEEDDVEKLNEVEKTFKEIDTEKPVSKRPSVINLSKVLDADRGRQPIIINKDPGDIRWAD